MSITIKGKTILGPNIVTDGLQIFMDFANIKSYPGTGTNITNLINNSVGYLKNNTTYSNVNGGIITTNGANSGQPNEVTQNYNATKSRFGL